MDTVKNRVAALVRRYAIDAPALGMVILALDGLSDDDVRALLVRVREAVDYALDGGPMP